MVTPMECPNTALPTDPLARVCQLLNREGAHYVVVGAQACILHGLVRTTEDVDLLIEESDENYARVLRALCGLEDRAAAELTIDDLRNHVIVKVADEVEVDISRRAWTVDYTEASRTAESAEIEGVRIPYASLQTLIHSKSTYRERDRADLVLLKNLLDREQNRGKSNR
jgi:hypothetical protein